MKINPEVKEKVLAAANSLLAEGIESPTNDQVRERMGGGSLSHISPVMREWRESRKSEVVAALEMPVDLRRAIESSVGQVWTAASKLASTAVETVRAEADSAIEAATAERDEALTEVARLEDRLAQLKKASDEKDLTISRGREDLDKARSQGAQLASENAALASRLEDREAQIGGLRSELKEAREDSKQLQAELVDIARRAGSA
ncbi:MAG TPA: KfrA protein [Spongiibacteraceae bacterium]|nr:KfrA protein [Spongiibacteraceae bacterium]HCS27863.1 KfrA protein [Spongiibacteraceae bacterium]|tara:strand:- start:2513 stop:3124 length:612 start_codon:yes stop_codon:yes gene_type:complete